MEILTPFQKKILTAIGHSDLAASFYLTGGTALAAYYLQHRFSEDLDFFAGDQKALTGVTTIVADIAHRLDATVEFTRTFPTFVESFLTNPSGERVKMDFAFDTPFRLQPTELDPRFSIQVDNVIDIACNKLSALFDRSEPKDFVDVYFVNREIMPFSELFPKAGEKHVGMTNYWMAMAMQNVKTVQFLPQMIKPLSVEELQLYFLNLSQELMRQLDE